MGFITLCKGKKHIQYPYTVEVKYFISTRTAWQQRSPEFRSRPVWVFTCACHICTLIKMWLQMKEIEHIKHIF